ncbi:unnamed protein product [marine sediment metagenome]|uniref:NlpC/P60 domain-containing protein n=1 Tax=marine sediment metagenome TaxID=412755 RepID=X1CH07_9ZZZZ
MSITPILVDGSGDMILRKLAMKIAFAYLGRWYKWGGDDPSGFDCSGFVIEILQSVGLVGRKEDLTAAGLWERFKHCKVSRPCAGVLVFWTDRKGNIIHIEMAISTVHAIGASGGGSGTITAEDAIRRNAFIKIRPIESRQRIRGYADPFVLVEHTEEVDADEILH